MVWGVKQKQDCLECTYIGYDGKQSTKTIISPTGFFNFEIHNNSFKKFEEIRMKKCTLENYVDEFKFRYSDKELFAVDIGIVNGQRVSYVQFDIIPLKKGKYGKYHNLSERIWETYSFEKDEPSKFLRIYPQNRDKESIDEDEWPVEIIPLIDDKVAEKIRELKSIRPNASESIEKCLHFLYEQSQK